MSHYGGLSTEFSDLSNSRIVILPVPFDKTTTYIQGADRGPAALIEASKNMELYDIETDFEVYPIFRGFKKCFFLNFTPPKIWLCSLMNVHISVDSLPVFCLANFFIMLDWFKPFCYIGHLYGRCDQLCQQIFYKKLEGEKINIRNCFHNCLI